MIRSKQTEKREKRNMPPPPPVQGEAVNVWIPITLTVNFPVTVPGKCDVKPSDSVGKFDIVELAEGEASELFDTARNMAASDETYKTIIELLTEAATYFSNTYPETEVYFTPALLSAGETKI